MNNPLLELHKSAGAETQAYGQVEIVSTYGQPQAEYAAIRKSAGIMDCPQRGVLELSGKDRHPFLNNLLTQPIWDKQTKKGMAPGAGVYAFLLNTKGRIVADMNVLERGESTWLEMDGRMVEPIRATLEKYIFSEQVTMVSRAEDLHEFFLTGPGIVGNSELNALGSELASMGQLATRTCELGTIFRDDVCGVPGFVLICAVGEAGRIWDFFTTEKPSPQPEPAEDLRFRGRARPVGWAAFNTTRIEAGRPLFGIDFDETVLPAETGQLWRAVSFTKGCYLGQEVVARMHARGQLARQIVGIRMDEDALPMAGAQVFDDQQNVIGGVTSSTPSPVLSNAAIALGYVKKAFMAVGTKVNIPAEGAIRKATVMGLPFVPAV